jgi:hypothetical protein
MTTRPILLLVDSCRRVLPLLRSPALAEKWFEPSALEQWSNAGLAGHLARSVFNLERALETIAGPGDRSTDAVDVVAYYAYSAPELPDSSIGRRIRELGDVEAADGPEVLADRFAAGVAVLHERALPPDPATTVEMFGRILTIDDCAAACLLELAVHADDLAAGLGVEPPAFSDEAVDLVVSALARISRRRYGDAAVLRALARSERAPAGGVSAF